MRVLVVEDSLVVRRYVTTLLTQERDIEVLEAADGLVGLASARHERPDVILTDLMMPGLHGIEMIRRVMAEAPCPIVVLSGYLRDAEKDLAFEAIEAGAVDVVAKPAGLDAMQGESFSRSLVRTVRLMAGVPVFARGRTAEPPPEAQIDVAPQSADLVAIGASTGGPPLIHRLLTAWPERLSVPVLLAQHIVPGFEDNFVRWLDHSTGHDVRLASEGERIVAGRIYVAPGNADLSVDRQGCLHLAAHQSGATKTTNIDVLFESVAEHYGAAAWGVLLTGMGSDGAAGLLRMRQSGAFTIVQDRASSTIDGMPAVARKLGAATMIMNPVEIGAAIWARFGPHNTRKSP